MSEKRIFGITVKYFEAFDYVQMNEVLNRIISVR